MPVAVCVMFLLMTLRPRTSPLFPYTTLFRSRIAVGSVLDDGPGSLAAYRLARNFCPTGPLDRKSTRLNSSHRTASSAVFCLKKNKRRSVASYAGSGATKTLEDRIISFPHHTC